MWPAVARLKDMKTNLKLSISLPLPQLSPSSLSNIRFFLLPPVIIGENNKEFSASEEAPNFLLL